MPGRFQDQSDGLLLFRKLRRQSYSILILKLLNMKNQAKSFLYAGGGILIILSLIEYKLDIGTSDFAKFLLRVIVSLAASMVSVGIPGTIELKWKPKERIEPINKDDNPPLTLAEREPTIVASGAIAVFVLVYLFDPI